VLGILVVVDAFVWGYSMGIEACYDQIKQASESMAVLYA
jgi:hypothetical protein